MSPDEYARTVISRLRAAEQAAERARPIMPQPFALISSRDDQSPWDGVPLPRGAKALKTAAEAAGWGAYVRWSRMAIPAGYRESSRHKMVETAHLLDIVSVRLSAYGVRAYACWDVPGGFSSAGILSKTNGFRTIGAEALLAYVKG